MNTAAQHAKEVCKEIRGALTAFKNIELVSIAELEEKIIPKIAYAFEDYHQSKLSESEWITDEQELKNNGIVVNVGIGTSGYYHYDIWLHQGGAKGWSKEIRGESYRTVEEAHQAGIIKAKSLPTPQQ